MQSTPDLWNYDSYNMTLNDGSTRWRKSVTKTWAQVDLRTLGPAGILWQPVATLPGAQSPASTKQPPNNEDCSLAVNTPHDAISTPASLVCSFLLLNSTYVTSAMFGNGNVDSI